MEYQNMGGDGDTPLLTEMEDMAPLNTRRQTYQPADVQESEAIRAFANRHWGIHDQNGSAEDKERMAKVERLNYEYVENTLYHREHFRQVKWQDENQLFSFLSGDTLRWFVVFAVGMTTGFLAFVVFAGTHELGKYKFKTVNKLLTDHGKGAAFAFFFFFSAIAGGISSGFVAFGETVAAGSGIPEVKAYLNGSRWPRFLRFRTFLVKFCGVIFAIPAGLIIGKEGPMVHIGSTIAHGFGSMSKFFNHNTVLHQLFRSLRHDRDRRDLISAGASAGVSAAFGAPIGGILFALEEASSFWSPTLTWRAFFASMMSTFTLNFFLSGSYADRKSWGNFNTPGLITFDVRDKSGYILWELIPFLVLGIIGGFAGALFNHINIALCRWRARNVHSSKFRRIAEVMTVAAVTSVFTFTLPMLFSCLSEPDPFDWGHTCDGDINSDNVVQFTCSEGSYNDMASIVFTTQEESIKHLFSRHTSGEFRLEALFTAFIWFFFIAVVTYGISVPSGLFVPCILMGASYGRMMGWVVHHIHDVDYGTYALIGAASMLGGVTRMTISLTVILLEITNDIQFLLPIMLTLMVSKYVGDRFNLPLYDAHVWLKNIPLLEPEMPPDLPTTLRISEFMHPDPIVFGLRERVGDVFRVLSEVTHNGFPVVDRGQNGDARTLRGLVLRDQIKVLLLMKEFTDKPEHMAQIRSQYQDFLGSHESIPFTREALRLTDEHMDMFLDFQPFMNPSVHHVSDTFPLSRTFALFRGLGLRHLCVVNVHRNVVGIVTCKDLLEERIEDVVEELENRKVHPHEA